MVVESIANASGVKALQVRVLYLPNFKKLLKEKENAIQRNKTEL